MKKILSTFDKYNNSKQNLSVTEEKMYQHADPGPWDWSMEELKELHSSLVCHP